MFGEGRGKKIITLWLDVTVKEVILMAIVDGGHDLAEEASGFLLVDPVLVSIPNLLQQLTATSVLHNQNIAVLTFNNIVQHGWRSQKQRRKKKRTMMRKNETLKSGK